MQHAIHGLRHAINHHPNFVIHLAVSGTVIVASQLLRLSPPEWLEIVLTITVGLVIELINTSIEAVVDLVTEEWRQSARLAKDASAAAMLVYAVGATVIALIIFIPKFIVVWRSVIGI